GMGFATDVRRKRLGPCSGQFLPVSASDCACVCIIREMGMSDMGLSFGQIAGPSLSGLRQGEVRGSAVTSNKAVDDFLAYMKKSLAERMADAWLAAHGLDRDKLKAMKPDERDAVLKQMAEELKQQLQQAAIASRDAHKTADSSAG